MTLFLSTFVNKIDKKGRVSVPAPFRMALGNESFQGIIIFRSYKYSSLEGCSMSRMHKLSEGLDQMDQFSDAQDDLASTIFADAHQLSFDSDGRVLMPEDLIDYAGLKDRAAFVGRGSTFQIWTPEAFTAHQEQARMRAMEQKATLRLNVVKDKGE